MTTAAIEAQGLAKRYGSITGVDELSLRVETGEVWRLLRNESVTHLSAAPTVLAMIADAREAGLGPLDAPLHAQTGGAPPSPALLERLARSPLGRGRGLRAFDRLLRCIEQIVPSSREIERFIRSHRPDIVLLTPVVDFNTAQTDQLKASLALGIPTGVCVASWDNLTNKGLIQVEPDLVTVWNEAQRR